MKEIIINDYMGLGDMVEIPCSKEYYNDQAIHVCKNTGLVRAKNLRSSTEIANDWSEKVFSNKFGRDTYTARVPAVKARQTYVADFIDVNIVLHGKKICDIGTGEGQFLEIVRSLDYGAKVFGIEPSDINCKNLVSNDIPCFKGTIEDYSESNESISGNFDIITIMWTLVNSYSCLDMISTAYDLLKPGGYIVVAEGSRILVPFKKPLNYYFSPLPVDLHPYHFSKNSLSNLLKVSNFKIVKINRYIDTDILCIIGQKPMEKINHEYEIDDYKSVLNFFERWHKETKYYL